MKSQISLWIEETEKEITRFQDALDIREKIALKGFSLAGSDSTLTHEDCEAFVEAGKVEKSLDIKALRARLEALRQCQTLLDEKFSKCIEISNKCSCFDWSCSADKHLNEDTLKEIFEVPK